MHAGLDCWGEAIYQSPIAIAVLSGSSFSFLKYPKDGIRRTHEFELHGKGMLSEIYSGLCGIVMQRLVINWKLVVGYRVGGRIWKGERRFNALTQLSFGVGVWEPRC